jgi:hypothetical protein
VVSHGEVGPRAAKLIAKTVNVAELVLLGALSEAGHSGRRKPQ